MKGNDGTINRISYDFEKAIISAGQSTCEVFWFGWEGGGGGERYEHATSGCGKIKWLGIKTKLC